MTPDGEVIDRIERAELFAEQLCGVIEAVDAGPCADAQAAGLRRIADTIGDVPIVGTGEPRHTSGRNLTHGSRIDGPELT